MISKYARTIFIATFLVLHQLSAAQTTGLEIAQKSDLLNTGFGDYKVNIEMILRSPNGREYRRELHIAVLEVPTDGDKSLIVFDSPQDQKGTALLSWAHKVEDDDQYLFLPAIRRVKHIASKNRSGPFVGSEFAFEDLVVQEVEKYNYEFVEEQLADAESFYVVDRFPLDENSGYSRQRVWYDTKYFRIQRIEFFTRSRELLKVLEARDYKLYGSFWRSMELEMTNQLTGAKTQLVFSDYEFGTGLGDSDFSLNALRRAR